ncbi:quinone oxidoreductase family protein [Paramicrobacterium fandaimingii]|uniref:quinone oxidoreductase family protein n=1 Tax=Paramicrobacterium fandaimingii TaxID=2708079 RepID=UPI001FD0BAD0|nr:zinc-binding alcohol dehydrogenase family protein [Microbacterium fandaimingii]
MSMRALLFDHAATDASQTRVGIVPSPSPQTGQIVIDVAYAGVNFKDIMARRGDPGYAPSWPFTPGLEVAGRVRDIGPGVTDFSVGDRVVALTNAGGLAEQALADARLAAHVPSGVELAAAAAVPGAYVTAHLLLHAFGRVRRHDTVAVHSASGAVGAALADLAHDVGDVSLIGIVGSSSRGALARKLGYTHVVERSFGMAQEIASERESGVDLVFDPQGTRWLDEDLQMLAPGGRIVLFGNAAGGPLAALPEAAALFGGNAAIGGFSLEALSRNAPAVVRRSLERVLDVVKSGRVDPQRTVVEGLESAASAQQSLAEGRGAGKVIVQVS